MWREVTSPRIPPRQLHFSQVLSEHNKAPIWYKLSPRAFLVRGKPAMANPERKQFMVFVRSAPLRRNATLRILAGPVCLGPVNRLSIYSAAFEGSTLRGTDSVPSSAVVSCYDYSRYNTSTIAIKILNTCNDTCMTYNS